MIGYYIHHQGFGHLARAMSICTQLTLPTTALTSLKIPTPHPFTAVVELPRDDQAERVSETTAHGALHWAPHHDRGFHARMDAIAHWVAKARPKAVVTDVSVEVAAFVRLLGVPVIVMALPGNRFDAPHLLAHRLADHIVAAWPQELGVPAWLRPHTEKTSYVGGISRFDGRACSSSDASPEVRVLVLGGASAAFGSAIGDCAQACPGTTWTLVGGPDGYWKDDPWPQICAADVVVTHAGQSAVADVAAAGRRAVVIPQPRPFDEQQVTAAVLRRYRLATITRDWPDVRAWPGLIAQTLTSDPDRWSRWRVQGAAARAATAIELTAQRCAPVAAR
jgi:Glycosyltransferase family 28 C-terminal domain